MNFEHTHISFRRPVTSYSKIQAMISFVVRNRRSLFAPVPESPFFLDIGCGPNISGDWYNIDYSWRPGIHRCMDITKGLHLPPDSVRGAFTEHCLEHIPLNAGIIVLKELYAAMIAGAWARIVVPDAELYARSYVQSLDCGSNVMPYAEMVAGISTPVASLNTVMRAHGHQFIYDFAILKTVLEYVGFNKITKCTFKEGHDRMLLKDAEHRAHESLYVECQKSVVPTEV